MHFLRSLLRSALPSFFPSFLPSLAPSFLLSCFPLFSLSVFPYVLPSFHRHSLPPSFLPSFLPSCFRRCLHVGVPASETLFKMLRRHVAVFLSLRPYDFTTWSFISPRAQRHSCFKTQVCRQRRNCFGFSAQITEIRCIAQLL